MYLLIRATIIEQLKKSFYYYIHYDIHIYNLYLYFMIKNVFIIIII